MYLKINVSFFYRKFLIWFVIVCWVMFMLTHTAFRSKHFHKHATRKAFYSQPRPPSSVIHFNGYLFVRECAQNHVVIFALHTTLSHDINLHIDTTLKINTKRSQSLFYKWITCPMKSITFLNIETNGIFCFWNVFRVSIRLMIFYCQEKRRKVCIT